MSSIERFEELLTGFDEVMEDDRAAARYVIKNWAEIKELVKTIWKEEGHEGKPDLRHVAQQAGDDGIFIENFLGDADIALHNERLYKERKQFNEDQLNEFTISDDGLAANNNHYAIAECIKELEGMDAAMAYIDAWSQEEPESTYPDAVRISLYLFNKQLDKAREITEKYAQMEPGTLNDDGLLFAMMLNVCQDAKDADLTDRVLRIQLAWRNSMYEKSVREMKLAALDYGRELAAADTPPGMRQLCEEYAALFEDEAEGYIQIGMQALRALQEKAPDESDMPDVRQVQMEALRKQLEIENVSRKAQAAGRFEKLADLITVAENDDERRKAERQKTGADDPAALAARLLTPGAFRNLFISLHNDAMDLLRRVIDDPFTELTLDESNLLSGGLPFCVLVTKEGRAVLADDFIEQFGKLDTPAFNEKRQVNSWVNDCLYMAYKCYGVMKDTEFLKMLALNGTKMTMKDVKKFWQSMPADRKLCRFENGYIFDEDFARNREYMSLYRDLRKKYPLHLPRPEEIDGIYAYDYPRTSDAYRKMLEYLLSICKEPYNAYTLLSLIFTHITAGSDIHELLQEFSDFEDISLAMDPQKTAQLLMAMVNSTRQWKLSGSTPAELAPAAKNVLLR